MTATVTTLATRRRWTPVNEIVGDWTLAITCCWCAARYTIELADAEGPVTCPACDGPPVRVVAAAMPGAPY